MQTKYATKSLKVYILWRNNFSISAPGSRIFIGLHLIRMNEVLQLNDNHLPELSCWLCKTLPIIGLWWWSRDQRARLQFFDQDSKSSIFPCKMFFIWAIPGLFFFIFVFLKQLTVNIVQFKFLPMTGFEPWTSGIGSDRSTNCATTTAPFPVKCYLN